MSRAAFPRRWQVRRVALVLLGTIALSGCYSMSQKPTRGLEGDLVWVSIDYVGGRQCHKDFSPPDIRDVLSESGIRYARTTIDGSAVCAACNCPSYAAQHHALIGKEDVPRAVALGFREDVPSGGRRDSRLQDGAMPRVAIVTLHGPGIQDREPPRNDEQRYSDMLRYGPSSRDVDLMIRGSLNATGSLTVLADPTESDRDADYVVNATIIEMDPEKEVGLTEPAAARIWGRERSDELAFCRLKAQVQGVASGTVVLDTTFDGTALSWHDASGVLFGPSAPMSRLERAAAACAYKLAYFVALELQKRP